MGSGVNQVPWRAKPIIRTHGSTPVDGCMQVRSHNSVSEYEEDMRSTLRHHLSATITLITRKQLVMSGIISSTYPIRLPHIISHSHSSIICGNLAAQLYAITWQLLPSYLVHNNNYLVLYIGQVIDQLVSLQAPGHLELA
jgi:hypothetical protein